MFLSDHDIYTAIANDEINIYPFFYSKLQPASYDVSLKTGLKRFSKDIYRTIDPYKEQPGLMIEDDPVDNTIIYPGEFLLASTVETIMIGNQYCGIVNGKSSLGRLGLMVHCTAGFIDPGFEGQLTLELSNLSPYPIKLGYKMPIAQVHFNQLTSKAVRPYGYKTLNSKYQGQEGPTESRYWQND